MAKKLLVKTPQTTDGVNLRYDDENKVVYKESFLEVGAKPNLESINSKLPKHLQSTFEIVEVAETAKGSANSELAKRLAQLEEEEKVAEMQDRIDQLEAKKEARANGDTNLKVVKDGGAGASSSTGSNDKNLAPTITAAELIKKIEVAETEEDVLALVGEDTRATVLKAKDKRIADLKAE